jgi:hypothetical protein
MEEGLASNEERREELSLTAGGSHSRDPRWVAEETANDHDSWGKTTAKTRGLATQKGNGNGG